MIFLQFIANAQPAVNRIRKTALRCFMLQISKRYEFFSVIQHSERCTDRLFRVPALEIDSSSNFVGILCRRTVYRGKETCRSQNKIRFVFSQGIKTISSWKCYGCYVIFGKTSPELGEHFLKFDNVFGIDKRIRDYLLSKKAAKFLSAHLQHSLELLKAERK